MKVFAMDTSAESIGLGYFDGEYHVKVTTPDPKSHNRMLLKETDEFLASFGVTVSDIDYFAVVIGPGSFTGIRIGVATINAFAMATKKPVIEITSLEQLSSGRDAVLLDCKHGNYYVGVFEEGMATYKCMKEKETEEISLPKVYLKGVCPDRMLRVALKKIAEGATVKRARPFYIKSSSAETGE